MPIVLGVDSSTQSTKVEVRDADDGRLVASGRAPHPPTTPPRSEQHPQAWWDALVAAVHEAGMPEVAAIAIAAQQHGMVVLDEDGRVIRPAKLWNDTESAPQAAAMVSALGAREWARSCGSVPVAAFTISKLAWLRDHEPEHFRALRHVLLPHDWLTHRLTGRFTTDRGDASGTGYWSPAESRWRDDLLARVVDPAVDWHSALPTVAEPGEAAGELSSRCAGELGLPAGAPVAAGTGDNMGAALGAGLEAADVAISIGTSGTVYTVSNRPTADETGAVAGFADAAGRFLPLVCTLNATKVTDAFARLLGVDQETLDALALAAPAGADGVTLLPYLDGERTPNRPDAAGVLDGVRTNTSREQLARAAFEGIVCGLLDGLDALTHAGVDTSGRLVLVGGGAASEAYCRVTADLTGRKVVVPEPGEYVARGACIQAAAMLAGTDPAAVARQWGVPPAKVIEPDLTVDPGSPRDAYRALRDRMA
jgi:xylulokinase